MNKKDEETPIINREFMVRLYRGKSWFAKAKNAEDQDTQFITLWIAFNALYAKENEKKVTKTKEDFSEFIKVICNLDRNNDIYNLLWGKCSTPINLLLKQHYAYQFFWESLTKKNRYKRKNELYDWEKKFNYEEKRVFKAYSKLNSQIILMVVFKRIYTLRNQIFHGGASYNDKKLQPSIKNACIILELLLPTFLKIMEDNPNHYNWGKPFYYLEE